MNEKGLHKQLEQAGIGMPGMVPQEHIDELFQNYTVKYYKGNLDEPADQMRLQEIETKSMAATEIIMTDRQTYSFEGQFFIVLRYLERRP